MSDLNFVHIPYEQLPSEAAGLFFIFALGASAGCRTYPPTRSQLTNVLQTVWNTNRLTLRDLRDGHRMTNLIGELLCQTSLRVIKTSSQEGTE